MNDEGVKLAAVRKCAAGLGRNMPLLSKLPPPHHDRHGGGGRPDDNWRRAGASV